MGKKRVLVCDDAPVIRLMLKDILQDSGYTVVGEAKNGIEAMQKFKELKPDIVTMDIIMPEKDGIDALVGILREDNEAKVVMVTAIDQRDSLMKAIRAGATDYIVKPFEDERVVLAVKKALGEA
ncbi:MAG: response regulator [Candidatus Omnitrophica bacterium]|nr:response regulator [Candidatus Omnitrophota bacterium]